MALPITQREQHLSNEIRARFCCPEKHTFMDTIELERCCGLWVSFALILNQPQRGGQVVLRMLANVQQTTFKPIIAAAVTPGTLVHTNEYSIYARLPAWGYRHKTVCHGRGEYARDEDGDGLCEVHVNTIEGFWSLLRSWLRPHRGISQDKLPLYLGFFQFMHNARRRGKALLSALN